jgi:2-oxoisovalerate dehydrogenase E1 component
MGSTRPLPHGIDPDEAIADFALAATSRAIDDREISLQKQSKVFFEISGAGHESLGVGLARHLRPAYDWFFPYYRDLALVLGLGVTPYETLLQAVGAADDPASGGRMMPAHWGDARLNIVTQSSPTGSQMLGAVGCAEASRYIGHHDGLPGCVAHADELTYVSLGEGACSEGEVWEGLNTACTLKLPLLIVVADNGWAISVPARDQAPAPIDQMVIGFRGLNIFHVDGGDYFSVRRVGAQAIEWVRSGRGPALLHAKVTRPYSHSSADSQSKYRPADELADEARRDPLVLMARTLVDAGCLTDDDVERIRRDARDQVAEIAGRAIDAPRPDPVTVADHVYVLPTREETAPAGEGDPVGLGDTINRTLHDIMAVDERVRVFGEDVADAPPELLDMVEGKGGVFGTTRGLQRKFGSDRCYNTPLAEANIVGRAVGQALRGLRPSPEIQFFDYIWPAMQQIKSEAATIRWRSNGGFRVPMVIRVAIGGYLTGGAIWHSQCGESIFAHIPGLLIAFPSRAADAAGLLRYAFECEDPVLFLEHKHLLRQPYARDPYPGAAHIVPFGRAARRREGDDLTIVTWGATVQKSLEAAQRLHDEIGVEVEVIDLRTIIPYDRELIAQSVAKTHRLLVVHEDIVTGGFGAEIAAWAGDELFPSLHAPIRRVGALDTHVPYEPLLERTVLPQSDDITATAAALVAYH